MSNVPTVDAYRQRVAAMLARIDANAERNAAESQLDTWWFQAGFYEIIGCDRHGNVFNAVEDDADVLERATAYRRWQRVTDEDYVMLRK